MTASIVFAVKLEDINDKSQCEREKCYEPYVGYVSRLYFHNLVFIGVSENCNFIPNL